MSNYKHIEITIHSEPIPYISIFLNRPEIHNAFNEQLISELTQFFSELNEDNQNRAVVLGGHGRSFCAGADLEWMKKSATFSYEKNFEDAKALATMFFTINQSKLPVIGRIHGAAIGGGTGLVSVCDVVVASDRAKFGFSEVNLGIAPAVISPYVIAKIGQSLARELFITGGRFDSRRAQFIGLVHHIVPEIEIDEKIDKILSEIASSGPLAATACKKLVSSIITLPESKTIPFTADFIAKLRTSEEGQEGINAFLKKRKPVWYNK